MKIPVEARVTDDVSVREEVFSHITRTHGVHIHSYTSNLLGLYNMKWMITTDAGELFVKRYHPKRYDLTDADRLNKIERSLSFQQFLHDQVSVCPRIWSDMGRCVSRSESGYYYVIMQHFKGNRLQVGHVPVQTMYSLGKAAGRMHARMSSVPPEGKRWIPSVTEMKEQWLINLESALERNQPNENVIRAIERQGLLLSELNLSIFASLEPGWAHWDLWVDNMLVGENGEVCFVDFDTFQYGYPEIDLARALLSGALSEGILRPEPVAAFLKGYREERSFPKGRLPLALKLLWCREAHWWLKVDMDCSIPPKRFAQEMIWLTEHWRDLDCWYGEF